MRILISNDDGIEAEGIRVLCRQLQGTQAEVVVVAPNQERSASSHGISLHRALTVEEVQVPGAVLAYKTSGTPVDCVKWALANLQNDQSFDFMLSGINAGANLASDVLYSGTVAAAGEAALQGVPAIAFSLVGPPFSFAKPARVAVDLFSQLQENEYPADTFLSVNLPANPDLSKICWTTLGVRRYHDEYRAELDESGQQVYRYGGEFVDEQGDENTDINSLRKGFISITPLRYRFTNEDFLAQVKS